MRFTQILAPVVGLFAAANAWGETAVWTTVIETDYTTYCPSPTTFAWQNVTYTATSATTVTITSKSTYVSDIKACLRLTVLRLPLHCHLLYTSPSHHYLIPRVNLGSYRHCWHIVLLLLLQRQLNDHHLHAISVNLYLWNCSHHHPCEPNQDSRWAIHHTCWTICHHTCCAHTYGSR